jgi:pimeloyl-ACP methyl ester carboxylesterase
LAAILRTISVPTLIIHGARDVFAATENMEYLASLIPDSKLVVFEGSGHLPAMIRPVDVAATINDFFSEAAL